MKLRYRAKIIFRKFRKIVRGERDIVKHYGELNPTKTIYVIKRDDARVGLFSYFIINLGQIAYAEKKNYVPVIDMKNYANSYLPDDKLGIDNSWEYYFKQPTSVTLEDAYNSKNVIISAGDPCDWPNDTPAFFDDLKNIMRWRSFVKKYIVLSEAVCQNVEEVYNRLFKSGERILGIKCRGTDYVALKPKGHPIQPDVKDVIKKAKEVISIYKIDKIFIATEDETIEKEFEQEFPNILVKSEQVRREYDGIHYISEMRNATRENDQYLDGLDYLTTILILARCNCFLSGRNSGSVGVMMFADEFEYEYIWDLGNY